MTSRSPESTHRTRCIRDHRVRRGRLHQATSALARTLPVSRVSGIAERIDLWQQDRRRVSFVVGVLVRYREDRGRQFGALLSYYGFVSLFPLLLVLVTVLGIVLDDNADFRDRILDTG